MTSVLVPCVATSHSVLLNNYREVIIFIKRLFGEPECVCNIRFVLCKEVIQCFPVLYYSGTCLSWDRAKWLLLRGDP